MRKLLFSPVSESFKFVCFWWRRLPYSAARCKCIWGEPETAPRLDNVHRFMAGVYFGSGLIGLWAALTIRQQKTLIFLIALSVFLAGTGRLVSISQVGLPQPTAVWLGYLVPELLLPWIMVVAQIVTNRSSAASAP
jgi:Domain of unknown function (DUF4345)